MNTVIIEPTDVLFFRDAIPMSAGQGKGAGCRMPFPSTLHEAFRSSLLLNTSDLREGKRVEGRPRHAPKRDLWHAQSWPEQDRRLIATPAFRSLRIAGPLPIVEPDREGKPLVWKQRRFGKETGMEVAYSGLLLPVPLDVAFETVERCESSPDGAQHRWTERVALRRLQLWRDANVPARQATADPSAYRPPCLPVAVTAPDKQGQLHGWWTVKQTRAYLDVSDNGKTREDNRNEFFRPLPTEDLWQAEHRIGVRIAPNSFAAESGQLYAGSYVRPHTHTRLGLQIGLKHPINGEQNQLEELEWLLLGGDRRLARVWSTRNLPSLRQADPFAALPSTPQARSDGPCLLKWVLVTPAIFAHGSLPGWCWNNSDGLPPGRVRLGASKRKHNSSAMPGRAQLVSWCLSKPRTVSGWDVLDDCAKPTMLAVPEGSVYFFLCENRDTADALAKKLHWQSRSDFYGEKGCGYGLVSFEVQMHPISMSLEALKHELFLDATNTGQWRSTIDNPQSAIRNPQLELRDSTVAYASPTKATETPTPEPWSHPWHDQLGLLYHRTMAEKIRARPELRNLAVGNIDRWIARNDYPPSVLISLRGWRDLLSSAPLEKLIAAMTDPSELGHQERQNTPFAGILTQEERRRIREDYEKTTTH